MKKIIVLVFLLQTSTLAQSQELPSELGGFILGQECEIKINSTDGFTLKIKFGESDGLASHERQYIYADYLPKKFKR